MRTGFVYGVLVLVFWLFSHRLYPQTQSPHPSAKSEPLFLDYSISKDTLSNRFLVSIEPLASFKSMFRAGLYYQFSAGKALGMVGGYGQADQSNYYSAAKLKEWHAELRFRWSGNHFGEWPGLYAAPYVLWRSSSYELDLEHTTAGPIPRGSAAALGVGVLLGYDFMLEGFGVLSPFFGWGLNLPYDLHEQRGRWEYNRGIILRGGVDLMRYF